MAIDMRKQYRTRDGRKVLLLMVNGGGDFPVIGAISDSALVWKPASWTNEGAFGLGTDGNLIEVKPERTVWLNLYGAMLTKVGLHYTKDEADLNANSGRLACVKVTFREGDGL